VEIENSVKRLRIYSSGVTRLLRYCLRTIQCAKKIPESSYGLLDWIVATNVAKRVAAVVAVM